MKRKIFLALVLVLALVLGGCSNTEKDWQEQYDLGMRYLSEGDYEEAILAFTAAIAIDSSYPEAYMGRAKAYTAIGETDKAWKDYQKAQKIVDNSADHKDLAEELEDLLGELEEAIGEQEETKVSFEITVTDAYSDYITGTYYGDYAYCYHIPQINLENDLAAEVNSEIYSELYPIIEEVYSSLNDYGYASYGELSYSWYTQGALLSVVVEARFAEWHWVDYYVYTVSTETGERVSHEVVLEAYGLDTDAYYAMAADTLEASFASSFTEEIIEGIGREFYQSLITQSVSKENLSQTVPYVGENGNLCMVAARYSPAGASYYLGLYDLEAQCGLDDIQCTIDHTVTEEPIAEYTDAEITRMVADWYNHNLGGYENGNFAAFDSETYRNAGMCCVVVRFQNTDPEYTGDANTLVAVAEVDTVTGEMWVDGYCQGDLW